MQEKIIIQIKNKEVKLSLFANIIILNLNRENAIILNRENAKDSTNKRLRTNKPIN